MVPASLLQQFAIRITPQQALLKLGCKGNLTAWHQTGIQQVCSIPCHIYGEDQNADAKAPAQVKEGVSSLGVQLCCSASASLGVFDKLTLCQTECQTQLVKYTQCCTAAVSRLTVFTEMLSWTNEKGKEGLNLLLTSETFSSSQTVIIPPTFPPPTFFFG